MDVHSPDQRSRNMKAIKGKNTKIEELLAKALWSRGVRYRRNSKGVYGRPDFSIKKYKIAIFCDSEFFHGKDWNHQKNRIKSNVDFWHKKIESNIARDHKVNQRLLKDGWKVIRFWGEDIKKNTDICVEKVLHEIIRRKGRNEQV